MVGHRFLELGIIIPQATWTRSVVNGHKTLETQHAVFVMSGGRLVDLSPTFSHLELDSVLVDSSNSR